ncbi:MAG: hypothetical protein QXH42_02875 [Thermoplasmata archaeon]
MTDEIPGRTAHCAWAEREGGGGRFNGFSPERLAGKGSREDAAVPHTTARGVRTLSTPVEKESVWSGSLTP